MIGPSLSVVHTVPSCRRNLAPALSSPPKQNEPSNSPGANHLNPTGTLAQPAAKFLHHPVNHAAADQRFTYRSPGSPAGTMGEQVTNGHRQIVIGVHQS